MKRKLLKTILFLCVILFIVIFIFDRLNVIPSGIAVFLNALIIALYWYILKIRECETFSVNNVLEGLLW